MSNSINQLIENNYLYIPGFVTPERAIGLANSFQEYCIKEQIPGDLDTNSSHTSYNYIDFLELLVEKTPMVNEIMGETVLPTYSYARVYKNGSELKAHKDRAACEVSLTVHLMGDKEWPISIKKPNGEVVSLNLKPGDAMLYFGCDAEHWRETYQGSAYVQVFLHYVKSRGKRNNFAFDKMISNGNIEEYVQVFDNIISDELCDRILNEYANCNEWTPTAIGPQNIVDTTVRNTDSIGISYQTVMSNNIEVRSKIDNDMFLCAGTAIRKYNEVFPLASIEQDNGYNLLRYKEGQFYVQHTDSFKDKPRAVSCSFALNDDYEGGEFAFWGRDKKYRLKKGSAILFPSNFVYPHEIMPVLRGTRYSIVTWFI
jgi:hypothetical protein